MKWFLMAALLLIPNISDASLMTCEVVKCYEEKVSEWSSTKAGPRK